MPARGPAGLGSQSPATGPPGTRLGRDGGCAKAAEVPSAAPNYQRSSSRPPSSITYPLPDFFFSDPRREYPQSDPLFMHPPARWEIILRWGAMLQAAEVSLEGRGYPCYTNPSTALITSLLLELLHPCLAVGSISEFFTPGGDIKGHLVQPSVATEEENEAQRRYHLPRDRASERMRWN